MKIKVDKFKDSENWHNWIGKTVVKHSKKPFKCGSKVCTVEGLIQNYNSNRVAFLIKEDSSVVDCHQVHLVGI